MAGSSSFRPRSTLCHNRWPCDFADRVQSCRNRVFATHNPQERPQRQTVGTTPSDSTLAIQPLKIANKEHAKVNSGSNARAATFFIVRRTQFLDSLVKTCSRQHFIEFGIERMAGASGQFRRGNEQFILSDAASSKCHVNRTIRLQSCSIYMRVFKRAAKL